VFAEHLCSKVLAAVLHRHVVFSIPKRLRAFFAMTAVLTIFSFMPRAFDPEAVRKIADEVVDLHNQFIRIQLDESTVPKYGPPLVGATEVTGTPVDPTLLENQDEHDLGRIALKGATWKDKSSGMAVGPDTEVCMFPLRWIKSLERSG